MVGNGGLLGVGSCVAGWTFGLFVIWPAWMPTGSRLARGAWALSNWIIRHRMGYWSSHGAGDLPARLADTSKGSIAAVFDEDGQVEEVREWTGRGWSLLTGGDRERALDWLES